MGEIKMIEEAFKTIKNLAEQKGHVISLVIDLKREEKSTNNPKLRNTIDRLIELLEIPEEDIFY